MTGEMITQLPEIAIDSPEFYAAIAPQLARLVDAGYAVKDALWGDYFGYIFTATGLEILAGLGLDYYWSPSRYAAWMVYDF